MMVKIYNGLAIASIATMLAGVALLGYLKGSGRLTADRMYLIGAALRGELDDYGRQMPEATVEGAEPNQPRGRSAEEVSAARQRDHLHSQMIERAKRDVEARQRLLDQALQDLITEREQLDHQKQAWTQQREEITDAAQDVGFERELELVASLPPKSAMAHVIHVWEENKADAVRLIMQLDVGKTKRIFAQMKTPAEQEIMSQLLEQLRIQDPEGHATESGMTAGDAAP